MENWIAPSFSFLHEKTFHSNRSADLACRQPKIGIKASKLQTLDPRPAGSRHIGASAAMRLADGNRQGMEFVEELRLLFFASRAKACAGQSRPAPRSPCGCGPAEA